jgi:hypothetical protein
MHDAGIVLLIGLVTWLLCQLFVPGYNPWTGLL